MKTFREGQLVRLVGRHPWAGKVGRYDGAEVLPMYGPHPMHSVWFQSGKPTDCCLASDDEIESANGRSK